MQAISGHFFSATTTKSCMMKRKRRGRRQATIFTEPISRFHLFECKYMLNMNISLFTISHQFVNTVYWRCLLLFLHSLIFLAIRAAFFASYSSPSIFDRRVFSAVFSLATQNHFSHGIKRTFHSDLPSSVSLFLSLFMGLNFTFGSDPPFRPRRIGKTWLFLDRPSDVHLGGHRWCALIGSIAKNAYQASAHQGVYQQYNKHHIRFTFTTWIHAPPVPQWIVHPSLLASVH